MRIGARAAFRFTARQLRRAASLLAIGALATMRRAELRQAIAAGWVRYGEDAGTPAVLAQWEREFYGAHLQPKSRILLVGCGSGRDLFALAEQGHSVDGLDIAPEPLQACRAELERRGLRARLYEGPVEEARFEGLYDAVVFSWFAYGYLPGAALRVETLRTLRGVLAPGGRVLLTYQPRAARASASALRAAFARLVARLSRADWTPQRGDTAELLQLHGRQAVHFEHSFAPEELVAEAHAAQLRVHWHEQAREGRVVLLRD